MTMTQDEAIEILEEIARDPDAYPSARVTAIRALLELDKEQKPEPQPFPHLYGAPAVNGPRRRAK